MLSKMLLAELANKCVLKEVAEADAQLAAAERRGADALAEARNRTSAPFGSNLETMQSASDKRHPAAQASKCSKFDIMILVFVSPDC